MPTVTTSSFGPSPQFENTAGTPAVGDKLFFYQAGTNTKLDTYTNSTGTVFNTNPIILNALGMPPNELWWTAVPYKVVWAPSTDTDPPSSPIRTWDNQTGVNQVLPSALADTTSPLSGAGLIGFNSSLSYAVGTIGRWLKDLAASTGAALIGYGAGTVKSDLDAARPIARGGTGATTVAAAITNLGLINVATETYITGATVLTATALGTSIVIIDSGTPANYTVTLPTGSATGSIIMLRVSSAATKLYTIAGSDVGLDGQANRVLWRGESCLLLRESGQWTKIGGRTIPFRGVLQRQSAQSITAGSTWQKALLTSESGDAYSLALCFDAVNSRFKAPRQGSYAFSGYLSIVATVSVAVCDADLTLSQDGAGVATAIPSTNVRLPYPIGGARIIVNGTGLAFPMNAGSYVELLGRISGGGTIATPSFEFVGSTIVTSLSYEESPLW